MWIQLLTSRLMKPKRSLVSSKTRAFFWSILFLIQENVSNCSQFEVTLQLLQDFFSHSLKIRKNKSVTTSKPVICSKLRHFFFEDSIAFAMLRRKIKGQLHCESIILILINCFRFRFHLNYRLYCIFSLIKML